MKINKSLGCVLILMVVMQVGRTQGFKIYSSSEKQTSLVDFKLLKDSNQVPKTLTVKVGADGKSADFELDTVMISDVRHTILKSPRAKVQILSMLNCSESEINKTFKPITSGLITLLDTLSNGNTHTASIEIIPEDADSKSNMPWVGMLIGGLVGLLAGLLIRNTRKNKTKSSTLEIDNQVWDEKKSDDEMSDISHLLGIGSADVERYGSLKSAIKQKYGELQNKIQQYEAQNISMQRADATYFRNLEKFYIESMQSYFSRNKFENDKDPQRVILENLLPLAIHYESYIKIKQKNAQDYDKLNYKNISEGGGELRGLSKISFKSNFSDNTPFVASLVAIMEQYDIDVLKEVNLYNQRIEK